VREIFIDDLREVRPRLCLMFVPTLYEGQYLLGTRSRGR
jgi:hypothetical protein